MEVKTKARLAMGTFLAACLIPSVGMFVCQGETAANQQLSPPPSLTRKDGSFNSDIFQETTDYIADHFAFRQELITADATLNTAVFKVSVEENVVLGKEGWLFYTETIDDYLRTAPLSDRQLWSGARALALIHEYVQDRGAQFLFTVAPNKATIYPEYLPRVGTPLSNESSLDRLLPLLDGEGVPFVDLRPALLDQNVFMYYRQDSHWNALGAALAQQTILQAVGRDFEPFWDSPVRAVPDAHPGDLYEMLYPTGKALDWDAQYDRPFTFSYVRQPRRPDDQRIETQNPGKTGSLLMFRDSFGNNLYPFMAEEFGQALFSRSMPCQLTLLDQSGADTVIFELVERNLDYLITRAPVLPAPERKLAGPPLQGQGMVRLTTSESQPLEGYIHLEGTLDRADDTSPIYLQLGDTIYEATPSGKNWDNEIPFTLYVPQEASLEHASVLCTQQGALCALTIQ